MDHMTEAASIDPTDRSAVLDRVLVAVRHVARHETTPITEDTRLFDELGLDSTSVLELLMEIEDALGMEFDADSLEQHHFATPGTLTDYVLDQAADAR